MDRSDIPKVIHDFFESSQIPLTLSDPRLPHDPLILANKAFYRMTGYGASEVLGKNCRFMQGDRTQPKARQVIRGDFTADRDTRILITNYRKSGEEFDNYLFIFTLFDSENTPLFRIGSQMEVPDINRADVFQRHTSDLRTGLDQLNSHTDIAQQHLINTGELVGLSVKSLLMARLDVLRSS